MDTEAETEVEMEVAGSVVETEVGLGAEDWVVG